MSLNKLIKKDLATHVIIALAIVFQAVVLVIDIKNNDREGAIICSALIVYFIFIQFWFVSEASHSTFVKSYFNYAKSTNKLMGSYEDIVKNINGQLTIKDNIIKLQAEILGEQNKRLTEASKNVNFIPSYDSTSGANH